MLTQKQIDDILNASRYADEGPTKLARRFEAAVVAAERERCTALGALALEYAKDADWSRAGAVLGLISHPPLTR